VKGYRICNGRAINGLRKRVFFDGGKIRDIRSLKWESPLESDVLMGNAQMGSDMNIQIQSHD